MLKLLTDLSDRASLSAFKTASTLFNLLPVADAHKLGHQLVRLWLTCDRRHRQIIEKNLEIALQLKPASPESLQLQDEIAQQLGYNLCELLLLQNPAYRRLLQQNLEVSGLEHLDLIQAEKSGAILVSAHYGNWELSGFFSKVIMKPIAGVAKPIKNKPRLYAAIKKTREEMGFTLLDKKGSAGALVRRLRKGGIIAMLIDQRARKRYRIWAPFFGHQVATIPSPAVLGRLSGCPVIPIFSTRIRPLHHRFTIKEPIFIPKTGDSREIVDEYTERLNHIIEEQIRSDPAQWFWPHDRWRKIKPPDSNLLTPIK